MRTTLLGGNGNDKIIGGNQVVTQVLYGNDADDILYGGDGGTSQVLYGDNNEMGTGTP